MRRHARVSTQLITAAEDAGGPARQRLRGDVRWSLAGVRPRTKEPSTQPTGRRHDGCFATRVVDRLARVVLSVQLDEQPELGPGQIDACDEPAIGVAHDELADRIGQARHCARQLDHERLEQALRRRRPDRTQREHAPHPNHTADPRSGRLFDGVDRRQSRAKCRLQRLLPHPIVDLGRDVHERLQCIHARHTLDANDPLRSEPPPASPGSAPTRTRRHREVGPRQADTVEAEQHTRHPPTRDPTRRHHGGERPVEGRRVLGAVAVHPPLDQAQTPPLLRPPDRRVAEPHLVQLPHGVKPSHPTSPTECALPVVESGPQARDHNAKCTTDCSGKRASSPNGVRTRVSTLRGSCPRPLDDGTGRPAHASRSGWT
jgi:hypothetical protein